MCDRACRGFRGGVGEGKVDDHKERIGEDENGDAQVEAEAGWMIRSG